MEITTPVMNIALATDDNYARPCAVCITSILENNSNCHIYILTLNLNEENGMLFDRLSSQYHQSIKVITVTKEQLPQMQETKRYPVAIYLRLLLPSLLECDKVLYLDCDIIVRKDLSDFYNTDLTDMACSAVEDNINDDVRNRNRLRIETNCYNSGVLLMNLKYWRENNVADKLIQYMCEQYGKLRFPDQDALNIVYGDKIVRAPFSYNMQHNFYGNKKDLFLHWTKWDEVDKYKDDPSIVHYTDSIKPWHLDCSHPHKDWFWYYAKKNDFINIKAEPFYPLYYRAVMAITGKIQKIAYGYCRKDKVKK